MNVILRVYSLLTTNKMSLFDFFVRLDTNQSTKLSELEIRTGLAAMGMEINDAEHKLLWEFMHKPKDKKEQSLSSKNLNQISYIDMLEAFVKAGCIKFSKT